MKKYTEIVASHLNGKFPDLVEGIFANDVAYDLSNGEKPKDAYAKRRKGIDRYYRSRKRGEEIFNYVCRYMSNGTTFTI